MRILLLSVAVLAITACGDDSNTAADAPGAIDAAADAPTDAPMISGDLIGRWRRVPNTIDEPDPVAERDVLVLSGDGTFRFEEFGDAPELGTFIADDRTITVTEPAMGGGTTTVKVTYYATQDRLLLPGLLPVGAVNGTVGSWRSESTIDGMPRDQQMDFRADMTASLTQGGMTFSGIWVYDDADVVLTVQIMTTTVNIHVQELRGIAMGALYERIPAVAPGPAPGTPKTKINTKPPFGFARPFAR